MLVLPAFANEEVMKDETVYANLKQRRGAGVYVVNAFELGKDSVITDMVL